MGGIDRGDIIQRTKLLVYTGIPEDDVITNLKNMLSRELREDDTFKMEAIEVYDGDLTKIPSFPAICLAYTGSESLQATIGKENASFREEINVSIYYYFCDLKDFNRQKQLRINTAKIRSILEKNRDLYGLCRQGLKIDNIRVTPRVRTNALTICSVFKLSVPYLRRDRASSL